MKEDHLAFFLVHLFTKNGIFQKARIEPQHLFNWTTQVAEGYLDDNAYHNKLHAFDVTQVSREGGLRMKDVLRLFYQTLHFLMSEKEFSRIGELSTLEMGIMYMAAAAHDYEHPGFNNPFLINARHDLAITYNDASPLENHHAYSVFRLLEQDQCNVFAHLTKEDIKKSR